MAEVTSHMANLGVRKRRDPRGVDHVANPKDGTVRVLLRIPQAVRKISVCGVTDANVCKLQHEARYVAALCCRSSEKGCCS